jgi:hypothetical protein
LARHYRGDIGRRPISPCHPQTDCLSWHPLVFSLSFI